MRPYQLTPAQWESAGVSQLRMGFRLFDHLDRPHVVDGYQLRTYRPGDEDAWLSILSRSDFGTWDRARLDRMLGGECAALPREGIIFATLDDRPVGAANAFQYEGDRGKYSELGWVAVDPLHRGHGLAMGICCAVLHYAKQAGHGYMYLKTEDFRLPAIKTYLRLGFAPEEPDASHSQRWRELREVLDIA